MSTVDRPDVWIALSAHYWQDPAVISAGVGGELLFVRALAYSRGARTDGFIPAPALRAFSCGIRNPSRQAKALVEAGLWEAVEGGWAIRSWRRWNLSEDEMEGRKEKRRRAAKARWSKARQESSREVEDAR